MTGDQSAANADRIGKRLALRPAVHAGVDQLLPLPERERLGQRADDDVRFASPTTTRSNTSAQPAGRRLGSMLGRVDAMDWATHLMLVLEPLERATRSAVPSGPAAPWAVACCRSTPDGSLGGGWSPRWRWLAQ
jgi:hypothetical protein